MIDRTVEAIVLDWDAAAVPGENRWVARLRSRVHALCAAGVSVGVASAVHLGHLDAQLRARPNGPGRLWLCPNGGAELFEVFPDGPRLIRRRVARIGSDAAKDAGLAAPRVTTDGNTTEIGLTSKSDSLRDIIGLLDTRGAGPGLVLAIGDALHHGSDASRVITLSTPLSVGTAGSGFAELLALLDEQLRRRRMRRTPGADEDPEWIIQESGRDPMRHRITETLFTVGAAGFATRGALEEPAQGSVPLVLAAGTYCSNGPDQHLLPGPVWTGLDVDPALAEDTRLLDLRTGVLVRQERACGAPPLRTLRFASVTVPGVVALRAEAAAGRLRPGAPFRPSSGSGAAITTGRLGTRQWARAGADSAAGIGAVAEQRSGRDGGVRTVERLAAYVADQRRQPSLGKASELLDVATDLGFDRLLSEHRAAWAARWEAVDVRIPDDPAAQLAIRFALFQLWCNVNRHDELAVGARGLSGSGYAGHVFWDADAFVLPAIASIDPRAATAMIRYRLRRLDAARAWARQSGCEGARFPWEAAADGTDVTPTAGSVGGRPVPILTGQREEHVPADVAWAAAHHAEWTGTERATSRFALPLLVETARYWASRLRPDGEGSLHIENVIGPDEYHESVDDNAYTNVMARWNLRAAADAAERAAIRTDEPVRWRALAERIVDGYDPATGRYEQFAGYFGLEPLLIVDFAEPPVAADVLLGHDRVAASQLIKQPDVLMLHHLVPAEVHPGSLQPNLDFYGPRTAHGSSLSPSVTAALLARAGRADEALAILRLALTLDIGDTTGMTAAGLHMANLGGVWQAVLTGFAGVTARAGVLTVDPRLPTAWDSLEVRFRCLGRRVRLMTTPDGVVLHTDGPLRARLAGDEPRLVSGTAHLGQAEESVLPRQRGTR